VTEILRDVVKVTVDFSAKPHFASSPRLQGLTKALAPSALAGMRAFSTRTTS
jgi:hypothetical protein